MPERDIPDYADVMTIQEFRDACAIRAFIDYDGVGHYCHPGRGKMDTNYVSIELLLEGVYPDPEYYTHVAWFNR